MARYVEDEDDYYYEEGESGEGDAYSYYEDDEGYEYREEHADGGEYAEAE